MSHDYQLLQLNQYELSVAPLPPLIIRLQALHDSLSSSSISENIEEAFLIVNQGTAALTTSRLGPIHYRKLWEECKRLLDCFLKVIIKCQSQGISKVNLYERAQYHPAIVVRPSSPILIFLI
jgi:hypothetical protein